MARILIVDDCAEQRGLYGALLAASGHDVVLAANGREAMKRLRTGTFDLVVTDIFMPECDGVELIRAVRRAQPRLPILAVSGGGDGGDGILYLPLAQKLGATVALSKAARVQAFLAVVADLLAAGDRAAA